MKFHGLDCECCKDKSPGVEEILKEISLIVGDLSPSETKETLKSLENLSASELEGQIDDILEIAREFFSLPIESIETEDLILEDPTKKVGKFLVKDLSDVPTLDITKVMDFSRLNLTKIDSLKFSLSIPTIEIQKTVSVPLLNVDIKFLINRKGFFYFPVLDDEIKTREDAIQRIKGSTYTKPVSYEKDLAEAKTVALENYPSSKEVREAVEKSLTTEELLNNLGKIGVVLFEEVDVEKEISEIIQREQEDLQIPIYDDDCGRKDVSFAPFDAENLVEIEKDCCQETPPEAPDDSNPDESDIFTDFDGDQALEELQNFVTDLDTANQQIVECSIEKQNAINNYYWFKEAAFLNQIAIEYTSSRSMMLDTYLGDLTTLVKERNRKLQLSAALKEEENSLIAETFKKLSLTSKRFTSFALNVNNIKITAQQLNVIENDSTFRASAKSIRDRLSQNEIEIQELSSKIEDEKKMLPLPSFSPEEVEALLKIGPTAGVSPSFIENSSNIAKQKFLINSNPISNQIGYYSPVPAFPTSQLRILIHPEIVQEAKTLFQMYAIEKGDLADYIHPLEIERKGIIADKLWNKFYSAKRIETFFTWQERGFLSPPPEYDDNGNPVRITTINVTNSLGEEITQTISADSLDIQIDTEAAEKFWITVEEKTSEKVTAVFNQILLSREYLDFLGKIKEAAKKQAALSIGVDLFFRELAYTTRTFNSYTNTYNFNSRVVDSSFNFSDNFKNPFRSIYDSLYSFQQSLLEKIESLSNFIESKRQCISEQEQIIIDRSLSYSRIASPGNSSPAPDNCASLLGTDPSGMRYSRCPGIEKNCYWKEYTKLLQSVSVMPILDDVSTGQLRKRLFRYYSVGIKIPVPSPTPGVLPTLAMGIPDRFISIPMPLFWRHITTVNSPIGLFVVWIATCGPVPGPFVMFIDENMEPCFLVSPKGPISIPAKSLKIPKSADNSLLDTLPKLKDTFRIDVSKSPYRKILGGNDKVKTGDPDDPSSIIDKIQEKIKSAADSLRPRDPWTLRTGNAQVTLSSKDRAAKALRNFPPDIQAVEEAFLRIEKNLNEQLDSIKISSIKFPKDSKKLIKPVNGPSEFIDEMKKLLDSGLRGIDLGLKVPTISLKDKLKKQLDEYFSTPDSKRSFFDINNEINRTESLFREQNVPEKERVRQRAIILKKAIKNSLQGVADKITPEMLGFVTFITPPLPLPFPCYSSFAIEPVPDYFSSMISIIKQAPSILESTSDERFIRKLSKFLNLREPLPRIEDSIFFVSKTTLSLLPDLRVPDPFSTTLNKQILKSSLQNSFKTRVRLPHVGIPQLSISGDAVKNVVKNSVNDAYKTFTNSMLNTLRQASTDGNFARVLAVNSIIKATFGTDLGSVSGDDVKAFLASTLSNISGSLDIIKNSVPSVPSTPYKSIKNSLFPSSPAKDLEQKVYLEFNTQEMIRSLYPLVDAAKNLGFMPVLLAASQKPSRMIISKVHPFRAKQLLPPWEGLTLRNAPFVIWLDELAATAQKQAGLASNYVVPYYTPDA